MEGTAGGDNSRRVGDKGGEGRRGCGKVNNILGRLITKELREEEVVSSRVVDGGFIAN